MSALIIRPILILGTTFHVFPEPDCKLFVTIDVDSARSKLESLYGEVLQWLKPYATFLEPVVLKDEADTEELAKHACEADALFVYISGGMGFEALQTLWDIPIPIIAFSGENTPMMGLYSLPVEELEYHPNVTYALDHKEVIDQLRLLEVGKRLRNSKMILLGRHDRETYAWEQFPDTVIGKRKLGVDFIRVPWTEILPTVKEIHDTEAEAVAHRWMAGAQRAGEPSSSQVKEVAKMYLALKAMLEKYDAQAVSVGCLEIHLGLGIEPICFALATLRDEGFPAGCEADASCTLTMLILQYIANKPGYMGNFVQADPENNLVMISHGCSPARMAGRDQPPSPYTLVHSHSCIPFTRTLEGGAGVTSYIDYNKGQEVTVARIGANLDRLVTARGEIVDCWDSICDRTTIAIKVHDAREFFHNATGNHQVVVYGNHIQELRGVCRILGMKLIEI